MPVLRLLSAALVFSGLISCSEAPTNRTASPATTAAPPDTAAINAAARQFRVHYNPPIDLDSTDFYFQPVSVVEVDPRRGIAKSFSSSYEEGSDNSTFAEGTCYNLIFFRKSTPVEQHPLLAHSRFVITEVSTEKKPAVRWPFLFYTIIKADTDADGLQNDDDASSLFVSDRSGRQLRQLTPDGTRLERRVFLPKTSLVLVEVRPDADRNHRFSYADGTYWLRFDLANLAAPPVRQPGPALADTLRQQMLNRQSRLPK